jgi:primosomal protein N' (replication factor Y)
MPEETFYAEIILPLALRQTYSYEIKQAQIKNIAVGKRVTVQFGKRRIYTGIIHSIHTQKPPVSDLKSIQTILDDYPIVTEIQLKFWEWMAEYYMCSLGEIFKAALPNGLKLESESRLICNASFVDKSLLGNEERILYDFLERENGLAVHKLESGVNIKDHHGVLQNLIRKKAIFVEERLIDSYKPIKETFLSLSKNSLSKGQKILDSKALARSPKQKELMEFFFNQLHEGKQEIHITKIRERFTPHVINALLKDNLLCKTDKEQLRSREYSNELRKPFQLNTFQEQARNMIDEQFKEKDVVLLHGVTSSGKTEIYIEIIQEIIASGKQVLYLLPEIALTSQIVNRLSEVFGNQVGIYHSKFNDSERVDVYRRQIEGKEKEYKLILGVRSAIFLPFRDLGLVIVDEEHENTYKQYDPAPRYHARDSAIVLGGFFQAKLILGTATPSVESFMNVKMGKYGYALISQRFGGVLLPEIRIADLRKARLKKEMRSVFTPLLLNKMEEVLTNGKQVILFQNRRGYSSYFECEDCGEIPKCTKCDVSLTYHKFQNRLVCHYCGMSQKVPGQCAACNSSRLTTRGFGTELVEDEIELLFPGKKIARLDLDTTRSRKSYDQILGKFAEGRTDILVGTQMLSKGLDFDRVALVGILNADQMLNYPDFRAFERSFQLMSQVSGRAGRKKERGMVVIQVSDPEHPIIKYVVTQDYDSFYKEQSEERQVFKYPPFIRMIRIVIKSKDYKTGEKAATILGENLRKSFGPRVLGPQVPVVGRIKAYYLHHILLKIERTASFQKARNMLRTTLEETQNRQEYGNVRVNVDVDPY